MSIEAMKQALESLDIIRASCSAGRMVHADNEAAIAECILRQAIEQAESQQQIAEDFIKYGASWSKRGKRIDPSEIYAPAQTPVHASDISQERVDETAKDRHEPVAWLDGGLGVFYWACEFKDRPVPPGFEPLYAAYPRYWSNVTDDALIEEVRHRGFTIRDAQVSPKREWVGLTKTEFEQAVYGLEDLEDCWQAIEAKLKEKNGG